MILKNVKRLVFAISFLTMEIQAEENKLPDTEVMSYQIIDKFAQKVAKEFNITFLSYSTRLSEDLDKLYFDFTAHRKTTTIEQARELEVGVTEKLLEIINTDEKIRPFIKKHPITANRVEVIISFENKKNPQTDKNIEFAFHVRDKIFYAKPEGETKRLTDLTEETYEEALKIVQGSP